jgi:hypothetical protein
VHAVALGAEHALLVTRAGLALSWGSNGSGQLGTGDEEVGEGFTDGVGDVFEGELGFLFTTRDHDVGHGLTLVSGNGFAPVVLAFSGGEGEAVGDDLLEDVVFGEV